MYYFNTLIQKQMKNNKQNFSNYILYETDAIYYYGPKHGNEEIFSIERNINFQKIQQIAYISYLAYSLLESIYSAGNPTKTIYKIVYS